MQKGLKYTKGFHEKLVELFLQTPQYVLSKDLLPEKYKFNIRAQIWNYCPLQLTKHASNKQNNTQMMR
jgi:hypothetical protein